MSKKSIQVVLMMACLIVSFSSMAAAAGIVGSKHDFSPSGGGTYFSGIFEITTDGSPVTETCVFCHTPHQASPVGFLWNRTGPSATAYTMYSSSTLTMINMGTAPTGLTLMCMSCHDGITSIAVSTLLDAPYPGTVPGDVGKVGGTYDRIGDVYFPNIFTDYQWGANIGNLTPGGGSTTANLSDDHPVSFTWVNNVPGIKDPGAWTGPGATALKLFSNRMECSTCHNVHNPEFPPFLRMANTNSDMCTTCHDK